jgi:hypothetical protein
VSLATLLIMAGTAEAGIKIVNPVVKQTGDPNTEYDFSVYLTNGTIKPGIPFTTSFTLDNLLGINIPTFASNPVLDVAELFSDVHIRNTPYLDGWTPVVNSNGTATVGTTSFDTTTLTFGFTHRRHGLLSVTAGDTPVLLGNFSISYDSPSTPLFPAGTSTLSITDQIDGVTQSSPLTFFVAPEPSSLVAPEPSSLVVVALVGSCLMGFRLLRQRRRVV